MNYRDNLVDLLEARKARLGLQEVMVVQTKDTDTYVSGKGATEGGKKETVTGPSGKKRTRIIGGQRPDVSFDGEKSPDSTSSRGELADKLRNIRRGGQPGTSVKGLSVPSMKGFGTQNMPQRIGSVTGPMRKRTSSGRIVDPRKEGNGPSVVR